MTHGRSRHPRRQGRLAGQRHRGERRHQGRHDHRGRRRRGDAAGARDARRQGHARAARRDRRHVHFRDPGYPHKEDFASGTAAAAFGGVTTVFDMPNTIPPTGTPEILAAKHKMAAEKAHVDFGLYALLGEDTIEHVPELAKTAIGFKLYMGNTFGAIPSPDTGAMLEAFEVVAPTGKRVSLHAETNSIMVRRELRMRAGRPHRSARAYRVAAGGGRGRGGEPRRDPRRMDRRAHPHPAHLVGRGAASAARSQGARRRHHRRDLPAIPAALDRRLRALRRRHPRQSAGAREAQPGAAVGGAGRRHDRRDRDRPRAAFGRGKDPQRHLDRRLRLSRRRDPDAADADRGRRRPLQRLATTCAGARPIRRRSGASIRARASSRPAPTPTSRSSISTANGRSTTPSCSRSPGSRRSTDAA